MTLTKTNSYYFTTRPKLVSFLMGKGYEPEQVPNPFEPQKRAWRFIKTAELEDAVKEYFGEGEQQK